MKDQNILAEFFGDRLKTYSIEPLSAVYFHTLDGKVVYIGCSVNLHKRVHHRTSLPIDQIFYIEVPLTDLKAVEAEMISHFRPERNWQMNRRGYSIRRLDGPWPLELALNYMVPPMNLSEGVETHGM